MISIARFTLVILLLCTFILLIPFIVPYLILSYVFEERTEDRELSNMHRRIDAYLRDQRGDRDEHEYYQIHTW